VLGPTVDLDGLVDHAEAVLRLVVADRRHRVERGSAVLDSAQHGSRGVITPDAVQAIGDFALPLPIDDHHQVEHPRRSQLLVGGVALAQQVAKGGLDPIGGRVLLGPDVLTHGQSPLELPT
jgi:hypothetical protein